MNNSLYKQLYVSRKEPLVIEYTQGSNLLPIEFEIMDWTIPTSSTAQIYVEKPSGALIFNAASVDGQSIIVQPTTQMTAETGANKGQIMIVNGNQVLQSFVFILKVFESIIDSSAIESQDEFTALEEALATVSDMVSHSELQGKGSATQPIYFDANGVAQETDYPLMLNGVNQAGIVPAPTVSKPRNIYDTNANGAPQWESMDYITAFNGIRGDATMFQKNFKFVGTSNKYADANRRCYFSFNQTNKSEYTNIPPVLNAITSGSVMGFREVLFLSNNFLMVNVIEMYPVSGRIHSICLNNGTWDSWNTTPSEYGGIMNGNASITIPYSHFFGAFSFGGNYALVNAVESSIVFLINNGTTVDITYSSGSYTVTNKQTSSGMRYHVVMGAYNAF